MSDQGSERDRLLDAVEAEHRAGRPFALATIVGTRGSTYRHAGARLLVRGDATWLGNISGGCLEGEVLDVGSRVIDSHVPAVVDYDLTADEEAIWGWGLGCNGAIDVLVEPEETALDAVALLRAGAGSGRPHVVSTVVASSRDDVAVGSHLLITDDGAVAGDPPEDPGVVDAVRDAALAALTGDDSTVVELDVEGVISVFLEVVRPPLRLLVCGAGHDAVPLVTFAAQLGWDPIVVDDRSSFLTEDRFPHAAGFVRTEPGDAATEAGVDDNTYVVVMSHNFLRDVDYLASFLGTGVAYLGMLGPSQRLERLVDQLADRGIEPTADDRARLFSPAGLDLGAQGPEEIAWSICAEILAVSRGRPAGFLRDRPGPIHVRDAVADTA